jgi:hypothetical protein
MKKKPLAPYSAFMLVGGPKNMPLMLEESGRRYATLFTSQEAVNRFQLECCALNSFQVQELDSPAAVLGELRKTQKFGCGLLLVDPPVAEIKKQQSQLLAEYLRQLSTVTPT